MHCIHPMSNQTDTPTTRKRSSSFNAVVADLEVGESASRAFKIDPDTTIGEIVEQRAATRAMLRNNVLAAMARAKTATGGDYSLDVGELVAHSGTMFNVVIVTRIA